MNRPACPWCGRTMDPGELESSHAIAWCPSEVKPASLRRFLSWEGFKELCAPITGNILVPTRGRWEKAPNRLPSYHCPECQVFLFKGRTNESQR